MRRLRMFIGVWFAFACACAFAQGTPASGSSSQGNPATGTTERYRIHPDDVLMLNWRFTPDFNQTVTVQPDGYVNVNVAGSVRVGGLTIDAARDLIVERAGDKLNAPELNLVLKEFYGPSIVVAGEVQKPGRFDLREGTTALQAILQAGGYTDSARSGQVVLIRKLNDTTGEVFVLKLSRVNSTSDLRRDMALQTGDYVVVPKDRISRISRYIRLANVGVYLNPLDTILR